MSFGYIKYLSLLIFSGLILTFYRATVKIDSAALPLVSTATKSEPFSLLKDLVLPLFPALDTKDFTLLNN